jgi:leucyl aminopeptidase
MSDVLITPEQATAPTALRVLADEDAVAWLQAAPAQVQALAAVGGFSAKPGQLFKAIGADGRLEQALYVLSAEDVASPGWGAQALRALPALLPPGDYVLAEAPVGFDRTEIATAFALGAYRFDRYKSARDGARARMVIPEGADLEAARAVAHACALARDMINTPANDLGPHEIQTIAAEPPLRTASRA